MKLISLNLQNLIFKRIVFILFPSFVNILDFIVLHFLYPEQM